MPENSEAQGNENRKKIHDTYAIERLEDSETQGYANQNV